MSAGIAAELVTVSEAARRLGVDKALVSRQVKRFGLMGPGKQFDLAVYASLRANALSPIHGGRRAPIDAPVDALPADMPASAAPAPVAPVVDAPAPVAPGGSVVRAAVEHKSLQADLLRLELEERRGALVSRAEIEEALETMSRKLRDAMLAIAPRVAVELGGADAMRVKEMVDVQVRAALEAFAGELERGLHVDGAGDEDTAA